MKAELVILGDPGDVEGRDSCSVGEGEKVTVGRAPGCEVRIKSSTISRRHFQMQVNERAAFVRDLESKNGTFLNGQRLESVTQVRDGDQLTAGRVRMKVNLDGDEEHSADDETTSVVSLETDESSDLSGGVRMDKKGFGENSGEIQNQESQMPRSDITCPHCWNKFELKEILAVSEHPELIGDSVLGPDAQQRFLPSRFTADGRPIDARGVECSDYACPRCHLVIPRSLTRRKPRFLSMVGAPGSGKTYLLTSVVWQLRKLLPRHFSLRFSDADTISNEVLNNYEDILFNSANEDELTALPKTEMQGEMYDRVEINGMEVRLPRPLMFGVEALPDHPWLEKKPETMRQTLVLYDNAGEHFQSGRDSATDPGTRHLVKSEGIFFVFDPTRSVEFRKICDSDDPQMAPGAPVERQEQLLTEAVTRIERHSGNVNRDTLDRPLVVVISKCDTWRSLLDCDLPDPWVETDSFSTAVLHRPNLRAISLAVRDILEDVTPDLVATAESFSSEVLYLPTSALGHSPTRREDTEQSQSLLVKPRDIRPIFAEVPVLYMLGRLGMLPIVQGRKTSRMPIAEDIKEAGQRVKVSVPGEDHSITLPRRYMGGPVRCPRSQRWFWLPE